jgi:hypothetical protein
VAPDRIRAHVLAVAARLAEAMPTSRPVRVVMRRNGRGNFGTCSITPGRITVTIHLRVVDPSTGKARAVTRPEAHDALLHEWAHAVVFDKGGEADEHGKRWGAADARAYRVVNEDMR